jgi:hypothetical protein
VRFSKMNAVKYIEQDVCTQAFNVVSKRRQTSGRNSSAPRSAAEPNADSTPLDLTAADQTISTNGVVVYRCLAVVHLCHNQMLPTAIRW